MVKNLFISFICLVFAACSNPKQQDPSEEGLMILMEAKPNPHLKFSDLFKEVTYMPIKLPAGHHIGQADKVIVFDGLIFIGDFYQSDKILVLDSTGNYFSSIKNFGEGPGEYIELTDFGLNKSKKTVDILSPHKILHFDYEGNFLHEIKKPVHGGYKFLPINENEFIFHTPANLAKELRDEDLEELILLKWDNGKVVPIMNNRMKFDRLPFFAERDIIKNHGDDLVFSYHFSDTIYLIKENRIEKKFVLDFGEKKFPLKDFASYDGDDHLLNNPRYQERYAYHSPNIHYDGSYLVTRYMAGAWVTFFYDLKSNKAYSASLFENDLDGGLPYLNVKSLSDNKVYSFHYPDEFPEYANKINRNETDPKNGSLGHIDFTDEDISFVVAVYSLK